MRVKGYFIKPEAWGFPISTNESHVFKVMLTIVNGTIMDIEYELTASERSAFISYIESVGSTLAGLIFTTEDLQNMNITYIDKTNDTIKLHPVWKSWGIGENCMGNMEMLEVVGILRDTESIPETALALARL